MVEKRILRNSTKGGFFMASARGKTRKVRAKSSDAVRDLSQTGNLILREREERTPASGKGFSISR